LFWWLQYNLLGVMDEEKIRLREEVQEQIKALQELKQMAAAYGDDVSKPATNSREAVQVIAAELLRTVMVPPVSDVLILVLMIQPMIISNRQPPMLSG